MPAIHPNALPPPHPALERRYGSVEVREITGWSKLTLHRRIQSGDFPQPEIIGDVDRLTWKESVLVEWMEQNTRSYEGYLSPKVAAREAKRAARKGRKAA